MAFRHQAIAKRASCASSRRASQRKPGSKPHISLSVRFASKRQIKHMVLNNFLIASLIPMESGSYAGMSDWVMSYKSARIHVAIRGINIGTSSEARGKQETNG